MRAAFAAGDGCGEDRRGGDPYGGDRCGRSLRSLMRWLLSALAGALLALGIAHLVSDDTAPPGPRPALPDAVPQMLADALAEGGFASRPLAPDDPLLDARTIVVTEGINEGVAREVVERLLVLDARDPTAPIDLYISTQGGWLDAAFAIADTIASLRAPVKTHAIGGCYSAGVLVLVSGTGMRSVARNGLLSIHASFEPQEPLPDSAAALERRRLRSFLERRTRLPEDWYPLENDRHYYLTPSQALEHGLVDRIAGSDRSAPPPRAAEAAAPR